MFGFVTRSIPRRIQACLIGIYIVTYVVTSVVVYSGARESLLDTNAAALHQLADLKFEQLNGVVSALATDLIAWSEFEVMNDLVSGDVDKRVDLSLEGLKRVYNPEGDIYAFDDTGKLLASSRSAEANQGPATIPESWRPQEGNLALTGKSADPTTKNDIIALEAPIFASFDKHYRVGTLVMTYPWKMIEKRLFGLNSGTMLLDKRDGFRLLAADREDARSIPLQDDGTIGEFIIGRSASQHGLLSHWQIVTWQNTGTALAPLKRVVIELMLLGVILSVPITLLGRWLSYRLTAPIAELTRAAQAIADTDNLDARVPVSSSDELGTLAQSFNRMTKSLDGARKEREQSVLALADLNQTLEAKIASRTQELEKAVEVQRRLVADISHEVKSPLARLSAALGLARRTVDASASKQFDRMELEVKNIASLASELLTLAKLTESGSAPEFNTVQLSDVVERVVADAIYEAPHRSTDVFLSKPDEPINVFGNGELLRRAIENVVRNAIFYTAEKTPIEIVLTKKGSDRVAIEVRDRGPGVPIAALAHLFEPFYRVDEARTRATGGSGIGLAICERAVHLHRGTVLAKSNEPHGLIVQITLQIAAERESGQIR